MAEFDPTNLGDIALGGGLFALSAALIIVFIIIALALYVYFAFAWMSVAKKAKHPRPWLAWIPFANLAMWLQMGGFHWAWVFLILLSFIPVVGTWPLYVLIIIAHWRVFDKLKFPAWLSLILVITLIPVVGFFGTIAYAIIIGIVAWSKENKITTVKEVKTTTKTVTKKAPKRKAPKKKK
jgi:hypothetical protein